MTQTDLQHAIEQLEEIYALMTDDYGQDTKGLIDHIRAMASGAIIASSLRSGLRYELAMMELRSAAIAEGAEIFGFTVPEVRGILVRNGMEVPPLLIGG